MLPLRHSIAATRNINTIHQIHSDASQTTITSHNWWLLNNMMVIEFWYLGSTVHDANVTDWMGDIALVGRDSRGSQLQVAQFFPGLNLTKLEGCVIGRVVITVTLISSPTVGAALTRVTDKYVSAAQNTSTWAWCTKWEVNAITKATEEKRNVQRMAFVVDSWFIPLCRLSLAVAALRRWTRICSVMR